MQARANQDTRGDPNSKGTSPNAKAAAQNNQENSTVKNPYAKDTRPIVISFLDLKVPAFKPAEGFSRSQIEAMRVKNTMGYIEKAIRSGDRAGRIVEFKTKEQNPEEWSQDQLKKITSFHRGAKFLEGWKHPSGIDQKNGCIKVRMRVSHKCDVDVLVEAMNIHFDNLTAENKPSEVSVSPIQSACIATAGWLLGLHPNWVHRPRYQIALKEVLKKEGQPLDVKVVEDDCKLFKHNDPDAKKKRALHVPCMNNKACGRFLMRHNEKMKTLADEQSGSRKKRRAAEVALQKVLTMDLLRQLRRSGFLCSNDALQCYDRIVHNVAMLAMLSRGACLKALQSLFATLQNGEHAVMTGHGRSDPVCGGKPHMKAGNLPIQGVLQGNGMGPFIWALISTVLLKCMESMGHVAQLAGMLTGITSSFVGHAFVDDTDTCFTAKDNHTPAVDILPECQEGLDFWQGTLECTGGGLEHRDDKTSWHLIDFKWTGHKWEHHTKRDSPGELSIKMTDSDERAVLCRKEAHEASETLGIFIAMDGNWEGQVDKLMTKATGWADAFRTCRGLERNDAWEGLLTTIMATFKCPAIATTVTEAQWNDIMRPVLQAGLPKAGIARNFPREVLFGPEMHQGMGMMHPFHFQELEHLETTLRAGNEEATTGKHLQMSLEALKLELGMPGSTWALDYDLMGACATQCWMKTVWKHCWDHCITLSDPIPDLPLRREKDKHTMQVFVQSRKCSSTELRKLNVCRCFLKATTLADICTADGTEITGEALEGIPTDVLI